jgi:hypothetical protein
MKKTSLKMKRHFIARFFTATIIASVLFTSCHKNETPTNSLPVSAYPSDVLDKWMTLQLRLMKNVTGIPNQAFARHFAYTGIAALESLAPGLQSSVNQYRKWSSLTALPTTDNSIPFYYPASVNAAMASINRLLFPNASVADKAAIDSLETSVNGYLVLAQSSIRVSKSAEFGKAVAVAVFNWSESDGYKNAGNPYTAPTGVGLWMPTAPAFAAPSTPYWGNNRSVVAGSILNTMPPAPVSYSAQQGSPFYQMVKQLVDASGNLTDDQKAMAMFWRDVPGVSSPGHWLSIMQQVIRKTNASLDKAALAYALTGAAVNDALIICWKAKYQYSLVRPITYIRDVFAKDTWSPYLATPPHPEYPSAHSSLSGAAAIVLDKLFPNVGSFTRSYLRLPRHVGKDLYIICCNGGRSRQIQVLCRHTLSAKY